MALTASKSPGPAGRISTVVPSASSAYTAECVMVIVFRHELQRAVRGSPAPAGDRAPAWARIVPANPRERRRAALRRRAVGGTGPGGARRVRRGAPRPGRAGALLRAVAGRGARGAGGAGLRAGPDLRAGDARPRPGRPGPAALRRPRRIGPGRFPGRRGAQGGPAPGPAGRPDL